MQLKASLLLSCCLFSQVDALSLQQRQNAKPKVFALNLQRNPGFDDPITHQSNRLNRRHPVGVTLANQVGKKIPSIKHKKKTPMAMGSLTYNRKKFNRKHCIR